MISARRFEINRDEMQRMEQEQIRRDYDAQIFRAIDRMVTEEAAGFAIIIEEEGDSDECNANSI